MTNDQNHATARATSDTNARQQELKHQSALEAEHQEDATLPFATWVQEHEHSRNVSAHRVSPLIKLYWGIAEKHERHLKRKEVLPLEESENDRQVISDTYKEAMTPQELEFDRRAYRALVRMQELRDQSYLLEELDNQYKMELIAWELKIRQHPIFFLPHVSSMPSIIHEVDDELPATNPVILNQDSQWEDALDQWQISSPLIISEIPHMATPMDRIDIDLATRERIRTQLIKALRGKTKKISELGRQFSMLELQILSKILSKKELLALYMPREDKITFVDPDHLSSVKQRKNLKKCSVAIEFGR